MSRVRMFPERRFVGTRDDMVVYDCDDAQQFARLEERIARDGLVGTLTLASFGPDTLVEARNRGFRPPAD